MPYYTVYFRYIDGRDRVRHDHVRIDANNQADAKKRVIRGEKPKLIAVDRVKRV